VFFGSSIGLSSKYVPVSTLIAKPVNKEPVGKPYLPSSPSVAILAAFLIVLNGN